MDSDAQTRQGDARSVFHRDWWLNAVAPNGWRRIGVSDEDALALVAVTTGRSWMPTLRAPPLTWNAGPGGAIPAFGDRLDRKAASALDALLQSLPDDHHILLPLAAPTEAAVTISAAGFAVHARVTYVLEADADRQVTKNKRRELRQARAEHEVRRHSAAEGLAIVDALTAQTFARQGLVRPYGRTQLDGLLRATEANGCLDVRVAYHAGEPHAAGVFVEDGDEVVYLLGGYGDAAGGSGPMALVLDTTIEDARARHRRFNFEGSMHPGIATFFRSLGGQPRPYFMIERGGRSAHRLARDVNRWGQHIAARWAERRK